MFVLMLFNFWPFISTLQGHQCWYSENIRQQCFSCYDKQQVCVYLQPFVC